MADRDNLLVGDLTSYGASVKNAKSDLQKLGFEPDANGNFPISISDIRNRKLVILRSGYTHRRVSLRAICDGVKSGYCSKERYITTVFHGYSDIGRHGDEYGWFLRMFCPRCGKRVTWHFVGIGNVEWKENERPKVRESQQNALYRWENNFLKGSDYLSEKLTFEECVQFSNKIMHTLDLPPVNVEQAKAGRRISTMYSDKRMLLADIHLDRGTIIHELSHAVKYKLEYGRITSVDFNRTAGHDLRFCAVYCVLLEMFTVGGIQSQSFQRILYTRKEFSAAMLKAGLRVDDVDLIKKSIERLVPAMQMAAKIYPHKDER